MYRIRQGLPEDAALLASLIMEAMSPECCAYFFQPTHTATDFHRFLTMLAKRTDTQYSYANALVAVHKDNVVGVSVSYDGALLHSLREPFIQGMLDFFQKDFSDMLDETQAGELYLDSFAVLPEFRHRGIGSMLLQATKEKAKRLHLSCVGLLVDDQNPQALKLYARAGFEYVNATFWGGHTMKHLQLPSGAVCST